MGEIESLLFMDSAVGAVTENTPVDGHSGKIIGAHRANQFLVEWFPVPLVTLTDVDPHHFRFALDLHVARRLRFLGLVGATVFRGLEGFGASARIYHARSLSISKNAPIKVNVIDTEQQIEKLIPHLDRMIAGGLIASSTVDVIRYSRSTGDS